MKIRGGFVSNSSSSSFIINYPKGILRLSKVEEYLGGYQEDVPEILRDKISYALWKNQFALGDTLDDSEVYECEYQNLTPQEMSSKCPHCFRYPGYCAHEECPHWQKISEEEHCEDVIESYYSEEYKNALKEFKKDLGRVRTLSIDDNEAKEDIGLDYEATYSIVNWGRDLFKSHKKILENREK